MSPYTSTRETLCSSSSTCATGPALDMSTSAGLSGTSFTHKSGTTFRSWVSIGFTGFVNAVPAGENAESVLRSLLLFGSAGSFVLTCLFHCYLDQKQACSRSLPFDLLIPEPFSTWKPERSWIFAVGRQVCKRPICLRPSLYTLLPSAVVWKSFALDPSDSVKGWLVNQSTGMTVSAAPESTTRGFGNGAHVFC